MAITLTLAKTMNSSNDPLKSSFSLIIDVYKLDYHYARGKYVLSEILIYIEKLLSIPDQ
jgi:hypothetical protein